MRDIVDDLTDNLRPTENNQPGSRPESEIFCAWCMKAGHHTSRCPNRVGKSKKITPLPRPAVEVEEL